MPETGYTVGPPHDKPLRLPHGILGNQNRPDGAQQTTPLPPTANQLNFAGLGKRDYGFTDDCTFFYTNEYFKQNGTFNWSTGIQSFKFSSCR